jgi:hypothetical protein
VAAVTALAQPTHEPVRAVKRLISHTEITSLYDCQARHAFQYTGHLTGGMVLKRKQDAPRLREGRAWGRAVAALHGAVVESRTPALAGSTEHASRLIAGGQSAPASPPFGADSGEHQRPATDGAMAFSTGAPDRLGGRPAFDGTLLDRYLNGLQALNATLDEDAVKQRKLGFYDRAEHHDMAVRLAAMLWHYATTIVPLNVFSPELEMRVPLPSRSGKGLSNRYVFHGYLDALTDSYPGHEGRLFVVEYKLRDQLTKREQVVRGQQYKRYAWAAERALGERIAGVIVDERLNAVPKPARWVKGRKKGEGLVPGHAKDQLTTRELYEEICAQAGVDVDPETAVALGQRKWQDRHPLIFRRSEIEEAGRELVSAGQLIPQLDSGALFPVRNSSPRLCNGCRYSEICATPDDADLVALSFDRKPPKRLRPALEEESRT